MAKDIESGKPPIGDRARSYINANGGNRLLAAIALLVCALAIYFLDVVSSWTEGRQIDLLTLKAEVQSMEALTDDDDLPEKVARARQTLSLEEARLYSATTAGLVSADIQSFLRGVGDKTGMTNLQITVNIEDTKSENLVRFVVDLTGVEDRPGAFAAFLAETRAGPAAYGINDFVWDARMQRVRARLETLALISEETAEP